MISPHAVLLPLPAYRARGHAGHHPFVIVSSKFSKTFDTTVHAASSETSIDVGGGDNPLVARSFAAPELFRKCSNCCRYNATSRPTSSSLGILTRTQRKAKITRSLMRGPPSPTILRASAAA